MKKNNSKIRSSSKVKAGVQCPACEDLIFSLYRHDFSRCMCGKVFVDGGDSYMRFGAEPPVELEDVRTVYRPRREAERLMSKKVRDMLPMAPPPLSYFTERNKYQFVWHWDEWKIPRLVGPYPVAGKFAGAIYRWTLIIGPIEIRRWEDSGLDRIQ